MKIWHFEVLIILTAAFLGGGIVFFIIPLSCVLEIWIVQDCGILEEPPYIYVFLFVCPIPIPIMIFLLYYRLRLYADDSMFVVGWKVGKRVPRKCKICEKHPLHQNYHARKIHNLKIKKLEENFEDCGCSFCVTRKIDWSQH